MGVWICCDGTDETNCSERRFSACIVVKYNRAHLAKEGWGRGLRKNRKRRDCCPYHYKLERFLKYQEQWRRALEKQQRDENRKARFAQPAQPEPQVTAMRSPSAASAPALST